MLNEEDSNVLALATYAARTVDNGSYPDLATAQDAGWDFNRLVTTACQSIYSTRKTQATVPSDVIDMMVSYPSVSVDAVQCQRQANISPASTAALIPAP